MTKIQDQTDSVERMLDDLDVDAAAARDATHFRRIIAARERLEAADHELYAAIAAAREAGDSWSIIGAALDVSRQAAQQRFERWVVRGEVQSAASRTYGRRQEAVAAARQKVRDHASRNKEGAKPKEPRTERPAS